MRLWVFAWLAMACEVFVLKLHVGHMKRRPLAGAALARTGVRTGPGLGPGVEGSAHKTKAGSKLTAPETEDKVEELTATSESKPLTGSRTGLGSATAETSRLPGSTASPSSTFCISSSFPELVFSSFWISSRILALDS